ncbi:MAG: DinB family protein [Chloroflexi bacterium]|nr:DinB family protein [Chloroflexota bacterium]
MEAKELVLRSLEQSQGFLTRALEGLTQEEASWSPSPECNSIAFILWHAVRLEDFFLNRTVQGKAELYEAEGWQQKLGTPAKETGNRYTVEQLKAWPVPKLAVLRGYANAVREKTLAFINSIPDEKLSEMAQATRPGRAPDSIGATLGRISTEIAMHVGQIAYLRGVQRGLDK